METGDLRGGSTGAMGSPVLEGFCTPRAGTGKGPFQTDGRVPYRSGRVTRGLDALKDAKGSGRPVGVALRGVGTGDGAEEEVEVEGWRKHTERLRDVKRITWE